MSPWSVAAERTPELMDDPAIAPDDHLHALKALDTINRLSRTAPALAAAIRRVAARPAAPSEPLHVIDIACGGGDVTLALGRRLGPGFRLTGIDVSERAADRGRSLAAARHVANVAFERRDIVAEGCPPCDIAVSSLFFHHLDDATAASVLADARARARVGIVISDLVRSRSGLVLAILGTRLLTRSRIARIDGPLSVRAARTIPEYETLCRASGLAAARIRRVWPERVLVEWRRAEGGLA